MIQTDTIALGRVVHQGAITDLSLVTRNFAQITALSPGVATGVSNAGQLGPGEPACRRSINRTADFSCIGARSYDNNFELDGISVSDVQRSASANGGNPDAIQEFMVQTGLYNAAYGRYASANISIVTKAGSNSYHGSIFEFFRNSALNANSFFLNRTGCIVLPSLPHRRRSGERMRKLTCTLTRYHCLLKATRTDWFNHTFQIKHHHGLNSSSVTTTLAASHGIPSYTDFSCLLVGQTVHRNTTKYERSVGGRTWQTVWRNEGSIRRRNHRARRFKHQPGRTRPFELQIIPVGLT
jgi:hypothetical protein